MEPTLWEKAVAFHGHECPGLAIGVRACEAAREVMGIAHSNDEEIVCITENDACGVDGVQALLGCTIGKGNLIFKGTGKMAFTFIRRDTGEAMRFYFKAKRGQMSRPEYMQYILSAPVGDVFNVSQPADIVPETARSFASIACEACGEEAPENKIRLQDGKKVCLDCYNAYTRGWQADAAL